MQRLEVSGAVRHIYASLGFKGLNHPDTFCYVCGEMTFKSQMQNLTPIIKKFNLGVKWVTKIKVGPLIYDA